jgi:hypothetical protein
VTKKKLPAEVLEYFRKQGQKGGKLGGKAGGKRSLETMTPEQRRARAQKAAAKSAEVRTKKAKKKRAPGHEAE